MILTRFFLLTKSGRTAPSLEPNNTAPIFGISTLDNYNPDIWDTDFSSKSIGYDYNVKLKESAESKVEPRHVQDDHSFMPHRGQNINESAGGHCILGTIRYNADTPKVQIGEIVGIKSMTRSDQLNLTIGVIRRIKDVENGIEIGVLKLGPCAHAIATSRYHASRQQQRFSRSLLLPEMPALQQPPTLITQGKHNVNEKLVVAQQGYKAKVKLTRLIESTSVYSRFEFEAISIMDNHQEQELQEEEVAETNYDEIWKII